MSMKKKYERVSVYLDRSTGRYVPDDRNCNTELKNLKFYIYSSHLLSKSSILPVICTRVISEFLLEVREKLQIYWAVYSEKSSVRDKEQFRILCKETRSIRYQTIIIELLSCLG